MNWQEAHVLLVKRHLVDALSSASTRRHWKVSNDTKLKCYRSFFFFLQFFFPSFGKKKKTTNKTPLTFIKYIPKNVDLCSLSSCGISAKLYVTERCGIMAIVCSAAPNVDYELKKNKTKMCLPLHCPATMVHVIRSPTTPHPHQPAAISACSAEECENKDSFCSFYCFVYTFPVCTHSMR